jgi:uracil-DNA glycosylase
MTSVDHKRVLFLNEMGIGPLWRRRGQEPEQESVVQSAEATIDLRETRAVPASSAWSEETIEAVVLSSSGSVTDSSVQDVPNEQISVPDIANMDWVQLEATIAACTKCSLCRKRTQTVPGTGDMKAKWLFIGEGPGHNEDLQGKPFVGPAGKLLDNMLRSIQLQRGDNTYIANIVKCRPTDDKGRDRPPTIEEINACMPYLERQIALIQPAIILALGKTAALSLLKLDPATPVGKLRGTVYSYAGFPLIVTYHPAYLLRNLVDKKKSWADLCLAMNSYASLAS